MGKKENNIEIWKEYYLEQTEKRKEDYSLMTFKKVQVKNLT